MRVAPVGLVAREPFDLGYKIAALTHGHPSGWLAAGALAEMVARVAGAVTGNILDTYLGVEANFDVVRDDYERCASSIRV
jgi:hypothetical protein